MPCYSPMIGWHFNPRSPRGERHDHPPKRQGRQDFNPRSPRGERHSWPFVRWSSHLDFNPRSPRGERHFLPATCKRQREDFNPRSPRGERPEKPCPDDPEEVFQSTLPAGGATHRIPHLELTKTNFNPRSPRGERLCRMADIDTEENISIHAPRGGSDSKSACFLCENLSIYHKFCTQIFLKAFPPLLST